MTETTIVSHPLGGEEVSSAPVAKQQQQQPNATSDTIDTTTKASSKTRYDQLPLLEDMRYDNYLEDKAVAAAEKAEKEEETREEAPPPVDEVEVEQLEQKKSLGSKMKNLFNGNSKKDTATNTVAVVNNVGGVIASEEVPEESWAERISQCHIDMPCGKLEIALDKDTYSASPTENDDKPVVPLQIEPDGSVEAAAAESTAEPWSTKVSNVMVSLGLKAKKEQMLMTDYYKVEKLSKEEEEVSKKDTEEKKSVKPKKTQKLITDYDPTKSSNVAKDAAAPVDVAAKEVAPVVVSVSTEEEQTAFEKDVKHKKDADEPSLWNKMGWKVLDTVEGLVNKFKKFKTGHCSEMPELPKIPSLTMCMVPDNNTDEVEANRYEAEHDDYQTKLTLFGFTICSCGPGMGDPVDDIGVEKVNESHLNAPVPMYTRTPTEKLPW